MFQWTTYVNMRFYWIYRRSYLRKEIICNFWERRHSDCSIWTWSQFWGVEWTANWSLHLSRLFSMLTYFATSGRNLYSKLLSLQHDHSGVYSIIAEWHHARGYQYWARISLDLVIEHVFIRGVKASGGRTMSRGTSGTSNTTPIWTTQCRNIGFHTSEQHKKATNARKTRQSRRSRDNFLSQRQKPNSRRPDPENHWKWHYRGTICDCS